MSELMEMQFGPKFDELRARYVQTPEDVEHYERTVRTVVLVRKLLMAIDEERQRAGMSKAELARRIGANPSVVRRLFSSEMSNPTLKTVLDMLAALGIDLDLKPTRGHPSPEPEKRSRDSGQDSTEQRVA